VRRRLAILIGVLAAALFVGAGPALAAAPFALSDRITDQAGVLDSGDRSDVQDAINTLQSDTGTQLFVVYVDSFDGTVGHTWAQETFQATNLSGNAVVLAVATGDGEGGFFAGTTATQDELSKVSGDLGSKVDDQDWAGVATTAADALGGGSSSSSGGGGSNSGLVTLGVVLALVLVAGGGYMFFRARRKRRAELDRAQQQPAQVGPPDPHAGTPTETLNGRASEALLDLDERVRTVQVNVDFARTHFGADAVPGGEQALEQTRGELARAFTIRQELDDEIPEDEPTRRRMLTELLALTDSAGKRLTEQAAALDALRAQEANAPQAIEELGGRITQLQARLPEQERKLTDLGSRYAASALSPVAVNVQEAGSRLAAAAQLLDQARAAVQAGDTGQAVGRLRPAEDTVTQSATLLDAIDRLAADVTAAEQKLAAARAETEADLAEARAMMQNGDPNRLQPHVARAEAELASAQTALRPTDGGLPDPLAALRRLEDADNALEQALVPARDAQTQMRRAREALEQALLTASSSVAAAGDFISTRRGAVGPEARTRLAEAERHLDAAHRQASSDPVSALREAQHADQLAQYALDVAQNDVSQWSQRTGYGWGGGYGGGYGGQGYGGGWGGGYRRGGGSGLGWGLGGLVLGGLLFGDHDGGGGDWGAGGGGDWGGGGDFCGGGDFGGGGDCGGRGDF